MDPTLLALRWAHVLGAVIAMGGLVFARFALLPAISELDASTRDRVHDAVRRKWLPFVIAAITVLLASGLANFLLFNSRVKAEGWGEGRWMAANAYHALFGVKFLLAMAAFYLASGLVGRGAGTQWMRDNRATWLSVTIGLMLAVVMISSWMRNLHTGENLADSGGGVSMTSAPSTALDGADAGTRTDAAGDSDQPRRDAPDGDDRRGGAAGEPGDASPREAAAQTEPAD